MRRLFPAFLLLLAGSAQAIEFEQLFVAGAGRDGELAQAAEVFRPYQTQLYVRFVYRDATPGQTLTAHWQIVEDEQGRSGEFASSDVVLEKAADLGQFSYRIEEAWPIGRFRVTVTEAGNRIVGEVDFEIRADGAAAPPAAPLPVADPDTPTPPPFTEIVAPPPARIAVDRAFIAGGQTGETFHVDEPVVWLRVEYRDARAGQVLTATWEHLGSKGQAANGVFARRDLALDGPVGQAEFSFRPDPAGSWLPGDYRVTLSDAERVLADRNFTITPRAPVAKVAAPQKKAAAAAKPAAKADKPGKRIAPKVLQASLTKGIENARPKELVDEFTNVWRRLLLYTRIDGGSDGGRITARWYSGDTLQSESSETVTPGENWVVFWLYVSNPDLTLPIGPARVELWYGKKLLKTANYEVKQAGFFEGLGDAFQQMGNEMQWLIDQGVKD